MAQKNTSTWFMTHDGFFWQDSCDLKLPKKFHRNISSDWIWLMKHHITYLFVVENNCCFGLDSSVASSLRCRCQWNSSWLFEKCSPLLSTKNNLFYKVFDSVNSLFESNHSKLFKSIQIKLVLVWSWMNCTLFFVKQIFNASVSAHRNFYSLLSTFTMLVRSVTNGSRCKIRK